MPITLRLIRSRIRAFTSLYYNNYTVSFRQYNKLSNKLVTSMGHNEIRLDKESFTQTLNLIALRVECPKLAPVIKRLHGYLLNRPKLKNVVPDDSTKDKKIPMKLVLLSEKIKEKDLNGLPNDIKENVLNDYNAVPCEYFLTLNYSHFSMEEILSKILPSNTEIPSSFETVGHLAHINLRDHQLPFKKIIGQVILDKNPCLKTVVNKSSNIETKFRTFPMEVIAGEENYQVKVYESKAIFCFDYSKVYWNSRLQQEHLRIIQMIKSHESVCDMFCGVGPFVIPLALKKCRVYANDLNPNSYKYLMKNIQMNKVSKYIQPFNQDGREFIATLVQKNIFFDHILMNLPATALEFLDCFKNVFSNWKKNKLPIVHCYCFSYAKDPKADVIQRAQNILGCCIENDIIQVHDVRDVSPHKVMLCLSFRIPQAIVKLSLDKENKNHQVKRQKIQS